jgi:hypothetical protein
MGCPFAGGVCSAGFWHENGRNEVITAKAVGFNTNPRSGAHRSARPTIWDVVHAVVCSVCSAGVPACG